jgi:hypothetical protein
MAQTIKAPGICMVPMVDLAGHSRVTRETHSTIMAMGTPNPPEMEMVQIRIYRVSTIG